MRRQKGISQIAVMVIMLVMAIALPITTKLVQQSQENRSEATDFNSALAPYYCSLTCPTGKTHKGECPTGFSESNCSAVAQPSTCPWTYTCCNCIANSNTTTCSGSTSGQCPSGQTCKLVNGISGTYHCEGTTTTTTCSSVTNSICVNSSQCPSGAGFALPSASGWSDCDIASKTCCDKTEIDCYADTDCANYKICSKGKCIASYAGYACTRDTQCPSTMKCVSGKCGTTTTATCPTGSSCYDIVTNGGANCGADKELVAGNCGKNSLGHDTYCCKPKTITPTPKAVVSCHCGGDDLIFHCSTTTWTATNQPAGCTTGKQTCRGALTCTAEQSLKDTDVTNADSGSVKVAVASCPSGWVHKGGANDTTGKCDGSAWDKNAAQCPSGKLVTPMVQCGDTSKKGSCGGDPTQTCPSGYVNTTLSAFTCVKCADVSTTPVCTESNWTSTLSPSTCPSSGQRTKTWTKVGTCTGGVSHPSTETVSCTYNAPACSYTYSSWSECSPSGVQTRTYTSSPSGCTGAPVTSQSCTYICSNGARQCYNTVNYQTCVNGAWGTATSCGTGKYCSGAGQCLSNSSVNTPIIIKMAFAGVKKGNAQCASNWLTEMRVRDGSGNNPLTVGAVVGSVPVPTNSVNSKGDLIYTYTTYLVEFNNGVASNGLSFFLIGPKHVSVKYGKNNQTGWYSSLAGILSVTGGVSNTYDFSEFPLLAGDVTGATVGTPDGKIDGRDFSYIKEKANATTLVSGSAGTSVSGDVDGNCQVNSGDVRLIKQSLTEINGQTY